MDWKDSRNEKPSEGGYGIVYAVKRNVQLDLFTDTNKSDSEKDSAIAKYGVYGLAYWDTKKQHFVIFSSSGDSRFEEKNGLETIKNAMYKKIDVLWK